jgi:hypothetical protein
MDIGLIAQVPAISTGFQRGSLLFAIAVSVSSSNSRVYKLVEI